MTAFIVDALNAVDNRKLILSQYLDRRETFPGPIWYS